MDHKFCQVKVPNGFYKELTQKVAPKMGLNLGLISRHWCSAGAKVLYRESKCAQNQKIKAAGKQNEVAVLCLSRSCAR